MPAAVEPVVERNDLAVVPVPTADAQAAVRRAAEDVVPEEDVEGVAILVLLPLLGPELGVSNQIVEHLRADVVAPTLKLLAEIVSADRAALLLLPRTEQTELLVVEVETVGAALELDDARPAVDLHFGTREREPCGGTEVDDVLDGLDLVGAEKHAANQTEEVTLLETLDLFGGEVVATEGQFEVVGQADIESDLAHRRLLVATVSFRDCVALG